MKLAIRTIVLPFYLLAFVVCAIALAVWAIAESVLALAPDEVLDAIAFWERVTDRHLGTEERAG